MVTIIIPTCAALAGLLVVVLIAYLIGRRRNRKGYELVYNGCTDYTDMGHA